METPLLLLVDGSSYLFRAFHALPNLTNQQGQPTGAIVGVVNMLTRLLDEYQPQRLAVVFDAPGKTFRHRMFADYKANRPPLPEALGGQIGPLHEIVAAMGLPLLQEADVEADDVIGTLARQAEQEGMRVLISTGDKDLAQLVSERIQLVDTMKNQVADIAEVERRFGVAPKQMVDYLALVGDTSDNIPGVPKWGPKTAAKWLQTYGSLDNLLAHQDEVGGKIGENLRAAGDQLPLSRQLATIRTDLPLRHGPDDLLPGPGDRQRLQQLYQWLGSARLLDGLAETSVDDKTGQADTHQDYQIILEQSQLDQWLQAINRSGCVAIDTETTSLDYMQAELVGMSFCVTPGQAAYLPLAHRYPDAPTQLNRQQALALLQPMLEDPNIAKIGQNLKYDLNILANYGIRLAGIAGDTMLESYVLDSTATRHDMDSLAIRYLGRRTIKFEDVAGKGVKQIRFDQVPLEQAGPYAAEDAEVTLALHHRLLPLLRQQPELLALYQDIEMPLLPVLAKMERTGVRIDPDMLARQSQQIEKRLLELQQQAFAEAGQNFNLSSPKQIGEIFFERLGLPILARTPKGAPSTSEEVLQRLADEQRHPLPRLILEHRGLAKLKSTYTDKLREMINPRTGRVHTSYHQAVAATGRLSSSDPNLQNIPIRTEQGRRIRRAFIAEPGHKILAADYSQIELRIMAHLSKDQGLLQAFRQGLDIHRATASEVFATPLEQVSKDQRRSAKAINFGLIYGMSAFGLAKQLDIGRPAAQDYVDRYFARYPGVHEYMEEIRRTASQQGYVETLFGRRLHLNDINASNQNRRAAAERTAINAPMQGTAADIIKRAMLAVQGWIDAERPPLRMIMQVHDELVFEVREDFCAPARDRITELMQNASILTVPLLVDSGIGDNWEEAH